MSYISNSLKNKESWTYFQCHQSDSECIILLSRNGQRDFFCLQGLKTFPSIKRCRSFPWSWKCVAKNAFIKMGKSVSLNFPQIHLINVDVNYPRNYLTVCFSSGMREEWESFTFPPEMTDCRLQEWFSWTMVELIPEEKVKLFLDCFNSLADKDGLLQIKFLGNLLRWDVIPSGSCRCLRIFHSADLLERTQQKRSCKIWSIGSTRMRRAL